MYLPGVLLMVVQEIDMVQLNHQDQNMDLLR